MAILKMKDIKSIGEKEREEKLKELRMELVKRNVKARKPKEIKKAIARLMLIGKK